MKKPELYELCVPQYEALKQQGLLWAFYPDATGVCNVDLNLMSDKEKVERSVDLIKDLTFLPDSFVDATNHNHTLKQLKVLSEKWTKK